jgi:hypothetical protein
MGSARKTKAVGFAVGLALVAAIGTTSSNAPAAPEVSKTGKGIAGGALLGGEIGYLTLAAAGAKQSWLYYTIPPLLAIGGGVGGYFIEQSSGVSPEVPLFMLAGGMALVIPTVVITLSATTYRPGNEDSTPADATPADAAVGGGVKVTPAAETTTTGGAGGAGTSTTGAPPAGGTKHKPAKTSLRTLESSRSFALLSWDTSAIRVGVPAVAMKPAYSPNEIAKFGLTQRWEVHAPILNVSF